MQIVINWASGTEYLAIDPDNLDANAIGEITETREWWPETGNVYWTVQCRLDEIDGGQQVVVTYEEGNQNDENILRRIENEGAKGWFGKSIIIVKRDRRTNRAGTEGPCEWKDLHPRWNGSARWRIVGRPRLRVTREQWAKEQRFRADVLAEDKKCVISAETTAPALDAAHICPVAVSDDDTIHNGVILRTDIHRLYDRGMFLIDPKDGRVRLNGMDRALSSGYKQLLQEAQLPRLTLERVREALQRKWENPAPDPSDARGERSRAEKKGGRRRSRLRPSRFRRASR